MKTAFCRGCGTEVRDNGGFCHLGHALYPWSVTASAARRPRRPSGAVAGALVGLALYSAGAALFVTQQGPSRVELARFSALESERPHDFGVDRRAGRAGRSSEPKALLIWRLGVYAPVVRMGLEDDGTLEVPSDASETGWYEEGPAPGQKGSAVIVGHFDSSTGPAVFYPLRKLRVGDEVGVVDRSGDEYVFEITEIDQVDKDEFPTTSVYHHTRRPTLRLITCEGDIDPTTGRYSDNLIAYGELVD